MTRPTDQREQGPLDGLETARKARLAFDLLLISSELLDSLGELEHVDRSWVHTHLYLPRPAAPRDGQPI